MKVGITYLEAERTHDIKRAEELSGNIIPGMQPVRGKQNRAVGFVGRAAWPVRAVLAPWCQFVPVALEVQAVL